MEDAARANRTLYRPSGTRRFAADDPIHIQQMKRDGLDGLRRAFPVMLNAVGIAKNRV